MSITSQSTARPPPVLCCCHNRTSSQDLSSPAPLSTIEIRIRFFGGSSLSVNRSRCQTKVKTCSNSRRRDFPSSQPARGVFSPSCFGERVRLYSLCQRWLSLLLPSPELSYRNWQPARRSLSIVRQTRTSHDLLADPHASAISDAIHSFDSSAHRCTQPIAFFQLHSRLLSSSVFYLPSLCHHFVSKSLHSSTFIRHQDDDYLLNNR